MLYAKRKSWGYRKAEIIVEACLSPDKSVVRHAHVPLMHCYARLAERNGQCLDTAGRCGIASAAPLSPPDRGAWRFCLRCGVNRPPTCLGRPMPACLGGSRYVLRNR